ncbi:potassium transporter [Bradyrhizobium viridifuturi]|jgi:inward rectifier potassium channel|uniref:ion channel n=4 Tax=Bacteria TaxID=2 RepID=UPI0003962220|nr:MULTISPECIES: ion channel [Bradyrhizobium]ERF80323.1 MAG: inward rectifier potassium channel [Bradyrhizobium sp. DFCI-1]OYU61342.1 MAG: potassium transporter [Bradyrhizobium sp. PARBB1]PSO19707.1 potassium transporter [Bradyrhizobium sp. MOS004]QRI72255.1 potassium transporter [Bradyrhizobium sp. PSBB068]MBR1019203.1 potassium transporter [Bradyrhizobium viridifuturi]
MALRASERAKARTVRLGNREVVTEGLELSFWADISHRCMTASWPAFIGGAALVFITFNAVFALFYWLGDHPIANVPDGQYIDYLYFSIETLSTAGYGDMHPQTHYGHFIAAIELFTGIFSMSLMTGLIFARFSRPSARLLFADNPVISDHEGERTLMIRLANERHNIIANATARLWLFKNDLSKEGMAYRRFFELPLARSESPALALSWTLFHVIDKDSPLYGLNAEDLEAINAGLGLIVSGYDDVAAQTVHARKSYEHSDIRFGHRYAEILRATDDGRLKIDYSRFHETIEA